MRRIVLAALLKPYPCSPRLCCWPYDWTRTYQVGEKAQPSTLTPTMPQSRLSRGKAASSLSIFSLKPLNIGTG